MIWLTERHLFAMAVVFYGLGTLYSLFLWRRGFREDNRLIYWLLLGGFALHTSAMAQRGAVFGRCPVNNIYEATTFSMWALVTIYLGIGAIRRVRYLGAFTAPMLLATGIFALMPGLDPPYGDSPVFTGGWTSLHAALILLSYGAFGLSSVAGLMYLSQEHDLKFRKLRAVFSKLPSMQRLDRVTMILMTTGFVLLTAGIIIAPLFMKPPEGTRLGTDPKVLWTAVVWAVYCGLLVMRWWFRQGGRRFAWGVVGTFTFILLTFWGTNLASSIHHP